MHRPFATFSLLLAALVPLACSPREVVHAAPEPQAPSGQLRGGAAKVDITPLPGVPLGGHSLEGGTGLGVWTRLWARAIYIEDEHGEPLVLIAADLWSIPAGLPDAVVDRVRSHHGLTHIGRGQLLLAATHTHHGPANFSSAKLYNRAASRQMGFDPALFEFLTARMAAAVAEAAAARAPARLRLSHAPIPGLARNRSLAPFAHNPEAAAIVAHNVDAGLAACPDAPAVEDGAAQLGLDLGLESGLDPCHAVDPTLTTLRLEDLDGRPRALAAFFAVHATSMVNATDAYNGDLFTVASAHAEASLAAAHPELGDPVVAIFNGAEGDVSPNWSTQGRQDALDLGARFGAAIVETGLDQRAGSQAIEGAIESGFARIPLASQTLHTPPGPTTPKRPLAGKAVLGGAEDGRTRYHARLPEGQTVARSRRSGQGNKKPAIPPALFTLVFPRVTIPQEVPISVHRIGPVSLVGLPGEFTTVMGMRIRQAVAAAGPDTGLRPISVGLAGEYMSYFVTPQEYALQHYEGGSTMWGPYAGTLVAEGLAALAKAVRVDDPQPASASAGPVARVAPGLHASFALRPGARAKRATNELGPRLHAQLELEQPIEALPRLQIHASTPDWSGTTWPEVSVEFLDRQHHGEDHDEGRWTPLTRPLGSARVPVDERGAEFVMFPSGIGRRGWTWELWWIGEVPEGLELRLHAWAPDGSEHCSTSFGTGEVPNLEALDCAPHWRPSPDPERGLGVVPG